MRARRGWAASASHSLKGPHTTGWWSSVRVIDSGYSTASVSRGHSVWQPRNAFPSYQTVSPLFLLSVRSSTTRQYVSIPGLPSFYSASTPAPPMKKKRKEMKVAKMQMMAKSLANAQQEKSKAGGVEPGPNLSDNVNSDPGDTEESKATRLFTSDCKFLFSSVKLEDLPPESNTPEIVFAGRSNVGKSSLLNSLMATKGLARTSNTPGRTQTINYYGVSENQVYLVDLPGYGFANVPLPLKNEWLDFVVHYLTTRASLKRVCILIDSRLGISSLDKELMDLLEEKAVPHQIIMTKSDKPTVTELKQHLIDTAKLTNKYTYCSAKITVTSSKDKSGINDLRVTLMRGAGIRVPSRQEVARKKKLREMEEERKATERERAIKEAKRDDWIARQSQEKGKGDKGQPSRKEEERRRHDKPSSHNRSRPTPEDKLSRAAPSKNETAAATDTTKGVIRIGKGAQRSKGSIK